MYSEGSEDKQVDFAVSCCSTVKRLVFTFYVQILIQDLDGARLLAVGVVECENDSASMRHDYPAKFAGYELDARKYFIGEKLPGCHATCREGLSLDQISLFLAKPRSTTKLCHSYYPSFPSVFQSSFSAVRALDY